MLKVLHVIRSDSPTLGGPSEALKNIVGVLAKREVEITVVTTRRISEWQSEWRVGQPHKNKNISYCYFPAIYLAHWAFSFKLWRWLQRNIADYDLVHIHGVFTFPPIAACYWSRKRRVPYIVRPAGTLNAWSLQQKTWKKKLYYRLVIHGCLRVANSIHATSKDEMKSLAVLGHQDHVVVLPLGISMPSLSRVACENKSLHLLFLSRIHPVKNLPMLLLAISRLVDEGIQMQLTIAGDGDPAYLSKIRRQIKEQGIQDRVKFVGHVQGARKQEVMALADVFVLPSFQESFGMAVVEAMASGLPVIISNQVALAEEVADAGAGCISNVDSLDSLVSALRKLQDYRVRKQMAGNARKLVEARFSLEALGDNLIGYYLQVINCIKQN